MTPEEIAALRAQLAALNAGILTGEKTITHNGKTITYRSVGEMLRARDDGERRLRAAINPRRTSRFRITPAGRGY